MLNYIQTIFLSTQSLKMMNQDNGLDLMYTQALELIHFPFFYSTKETKCKKKKKERRAVPLLHSLLTSGLTEISKSIYLTRINTKPATHLHHSLCVIHSCRKEANISENMFQRLYQKFEQKLAHIHRKHANLKNELPVLNLLEHFLSY